MLFSYSKVSEKTEKHNTVNTIFYEELKYQNHRISVESL